jgi:hypothetical protein
MVEPVTQLLETPEKMSRGIAAADFANSQTQQVPHFQYSACKSLRFNILAGLAQIESPQVADYRYFATSICVFF